MNYSVLNAGNNIPTEINAVVEIPRGEGRIKYEFRSNGLIIVDRLRGADQPLYPVHYCGMPASEAPDGDPLDILILGEDKLQTGDVIAVRPVGVFWMTDEKGTDPKIVCVPADSVSKDYLNIQSLEDISPEEKNSIETFFKEYKKNDIQGKWSDIAGWDDVSVAHKIIHECIDRWNKKQSQSPQYKDGKPPQP